MNTLITIPKGLNNSGVFKNGWQFDIENIDDCIKWNEKLRSVGITELTCDETGEIKSVDVVWGEWYEVNKDYLT